MQDFDGHQAASHRPCFHRDGLTVKVSAFEAVLRPRRRAKRPGHLAASASKTAKAAERMAPVLKYAEAYLKGPTQAEIERITPTGFAKVLSARFDVPVPTIRHWLKRQFITSE